MKKKLSALLHGVLNQLKKEKNWSIGELPVPKIEIPRDTSHGDYSSNIALLLSKKIGVPSQTLAQWIIEHWPAQEGIGEAKVEGPGFINFFLSSSAETDIIKKVLSAKEGFGKIPFGQGKKVIVEFVSVNPTGPIHVGHGRGAAYGASLSDILETAGYQVHREYYVNDAGRQVDVLTISFWIRYLELCGETISFPEGGYRGDYLKPIAQALLEREGKRFYLNTSLSTFLSQITTITVSDKQIDLWITYLKETLKNDYDVLRSYILKEMLNAIKEELDAFDIHYQEWFSEKKLIESGSLQKSFDALVSKNYIYEKDGAWWLRSTAFGDDKDRVVKKSNGQWTYLAPDIAYHWNKIQRGFDLIIDVLGADHHGYISRLKAAVKALGFDDSRIYIPLIQMVHLFRSGEKMKMGKRSGIFETLTQLRKDIGKDATRFFFVMRKMDQHLDFDLDLAKSQSNENPVYYIQYAHARICSVFHQCKEKQLLFDSNTGVEQLSLLQTEHEKDLVSKLTQYETVIETAAQYFEPHRIAHYLRELANAFHSYYNATPFLVDETALRNARLCLIQAVKQTIANGLKLLGVSAPETM